MQLRCRLEKTCCPAGRSVQLADSLQLLQVSFSFRAKVRLFLRWPSSVMQQDDGTKDWPFPPTAGSSPRPSLTWSSPSEWLRHQQTCSVGCWLLRPGLLPPSPFTDVTIKKPFAFLTLFQFLLSSSPNRYSCKWILIYKISTDIFNHDAAIQNPQMHWL